MYRTAPQEQGGVSRTLLDVLAASKHEETTSESLIAALGGKSMIGSVGMDDQFKLPDLISSEAKDQVPSQQEQESLQPLPKLVSKHRTYHHTHYSKEQIKLRVALRREQQRQRAEDMLQQGVEPQLTQEEMDEKMRKEKAKQQRARRYERRMKEKEDQQEDKAGKLKGLAVMAKQLTGSRPKEPKMRNLRGIQKRQETVAEEFEKEDGDKTEERTRKRKAIGCINP